MNLAAVDMNLLVVFDALLQERNVTRAGLRIGLTQPAVSNALSRLRALFKDDLFHRTAEGMQPTARALEIAAPIQHALAEIRTALEPSSFDPSTAQMSFTLATNDYVSATLLPVLEGLIRDRAPGARLRITPTNTLDVPRLMEAGEADLAIGLFNDISERLDSMSLWRDSLVLVARPEHPLTYGPMTLERLADVSHIIVSQTGQDDEDGTGGLILSQGMRRLNVTHGHVALRQLLQERGLTLQVALTVPYFLAVLPTIMRSDLVSLLPLRLALVYKRLVGLCILGLPFDTPCVRFQGIWNRQMTPRSAHQWLRQIVAEAARIVDGDLQHVPQCVQLATA